MLLQSAHSSSGRGSGGRRQRQVSICQTVRNGSIIVCVLFLVWIFAADHFASIFSHQASQIERQRKQIADCDGVLRTAGVDRLHSAAASLEQKLESDGVELSRAKRLLDTQTTKFQHARDEFRRKQDARREVEAHLREQIKNATRRNREHRRESRESMRKLQLQLKKKATEGAATPPRSVLGTLLQAAAHSAAPALRASPPTLRSTANAALAAGRGAPPWRGLTQQHYAALYTPGDVTSARRMAPRSVARVSHSIDMFEPSLSNTSVSWTGLLRPSQNVSLCFKLGVAGGFADAFVDGALLLSARGGARVKRADAVGCTQPLRAGVAVRFELYFGAAGSSASGAACFAKWGVKAAVPQSWRTQLGRAFQCGVDPPTDGVLRSAMHVGRHEAERNAARATRMAAHMASSKGAKDAHADRMRRKHSTASKKVKAAAKRTSVVARRRGDSASKLKQAKRTAARADKPMVFGLGLSKTGTTSLALALRRLGWNALHTPMGFIEKVLLFDPKHPSSFSYTNRTLDPTLTRAFFAKHRLDATTDLPISPFFRDLSEIYPTAKFILTTRGLNAWKKSARKQMERPVKPGSVLEAQRMIAYGKAAYAEPEYPDHFLRHQKEVRKFFGATKERRSRLLEMRIVGGARDKWGALCQFLEVEVPHGVAFPTAGPGAPNPAGGDKAAKVVATERRTRRKKTPVQKRRDERRSRARGEGAAGANAFKEAGAKSFTAAEAEAKRAAKRAEELMRG